VQAKDARLLREEKEYRKQQQQIQHLDAYIERFRYKATKARQAQSKIKAIERLEPVERTQVSKKRMKLRFAVHKSSEREVLHTEDLEKHYGEKQVFSPSEFHPSSR
jgi:ATP-binding cassette, subfamily F, member 3